MLKFQVKEIKNEFRIFSILALAMICVIAIGIAAYKNFSSIVTNISKVNNPGMQIVLLESLRSNLAYAESSVKSYNLTRDEAYLAPFSNNLLTIDQLLDSIKIKGHADPVQKPLVDSLDFLVREKSKILRSILMLKNNEGVTNELNRIYSKLNVDVKKEKIEGSKKLIKSKEVKAKIKAQKEAAKPENIIKKITSEVGSEIGSVKTDQVKQLKDIKLDEFSLLMKDKEIMGHIKDIIFQLEEIEKKEMLKESLESAELAAKTNRIIAFFCLFATLLMMLAVYVVVSYLIKNTAYKKELERARDETNQLAKAKESFLYNMSHELRTPMNSVVGFIDLLQNTKLNTEQKEQVSILKRSSGHLMQILNDILDVSKINAGKFSFELQPFSLKELLNDIEITMKKMAKKKNLSFQLLIQNEIPAFINGDAVRLSQILYNLIDNAIKFTKQGTITVEVGTEKINDKNIRLKIAVKDTGIGIAPENINKIFNEFEQAESHKNRNIGGTGLGLSITRKLVELQKGTISFQSEINKGSSFEFVIPYELAENNSSNQKIIDSNLTLDLSGLKILAADDEELNRALLTALLDKHKANYVIAENGHSLLQKAEKDTFDIILLDIRMPEISGPEVCAKIRALSNPTRKNVPIIAFTASASETDIKSFMSIGFTDILLKPYSESSFLKVIEKYIPEGKRKYLSEPEAIINGKKERKLEIDINDPDNKSLVELFISSINQELELMYAAFDEPNNISKITHYTHKLIPGCKMYGANTLAELLNTLEKAVNKNESREKLSQLITDIQSESQIIVSKYSKIISNETDQNVQLEATNK